MDPDATAGKDKRTAAMAAAATGNVNIVQYLASRGCDLDKQDKRGRTALHEAADKGYAYLFTRFVCLLHCNVNYAMTVLPSLIALLLVNSMLKKGPLKWFQFS